VGSKVIDDKVAPTGSEEQAVLLLPCPQMGPDWMGQVQLARAIPFCDSVTSHFQFQHWAKEYSPEQMPNLGSA
jgi:hypothetical protein